MTRLPEWWRSKFLYWDLVSATVACGLFGLWLFWLNGGTTVDSLMDDTRSALYTTLGAIYGALLGFAIATVSIVITSVQSERMAPVRDSSHFRDLWKTFFSSIRWLAAATIFAVCALLFDRTKAPSHQWLLLLVYATLITVLRLIRSVSLLKKVVQVG